MFWFVVGKQTSICPLGIGMESTCSVWVGSVKIFSSSRTNYFNFNVSGFFSTFKLFSTVRYSVDIFSFFILGSDLF